jgi:DNA-directed RNA polymerase subunit M/transcription elongation factor TFIIS
MIETDPAEERRRLFEHYQQISDGELVALARTNTELTDIAQRTLAAEISRRKLKVEPEQPPEPTPPDPPNPIYDEDRQPILIATVYSERDALELQALLDGASIPFVIGPEKATRVERVTSNFSEGVDVLVMNIALPWVRDLMKNYFPKDAPPPTQEEQQDAFISCPICRSEDVVFEEMLDEDPNTHERLLQRFSWKCDACGHEWQDNGIAKE